MVQCAICSKKLSPEMAIELSGIFFCDHCQNTIAAKKMLQRITATTQSSKKSASIGSSDKDAEEKAFAEAVDINRSDAWDFRTLFGIGKFISTIGWILAVIGTMSIISGSVHLSGNALDQTRGMFHLLLGGSSFIGGLLLAAVGEILYGLVAVRSHIYQIRDFIASANSQREST